MVIQKTGTFLAKVFSPSIAVKLAYVITAVVISGMALLSLFILGNQNSVLDQQADAYAAALGDQLSIATVEPLLAGDVEAMNQLSNNLARNKGIEGVAIFSDQSQPLSAIGIFPEHDPAVTSSEQPLHWYSGENNEHELTSYVNKVIFRELTVGYCVLTFDRSFMSAAYTDTLRTISAITAFMLVLGIIVAVALSRRLSRPIEQLLDGTQEISQGNYQFRFRNRRKDELGQLMGSLNTMTEGLLKKEQVEQTFSRYVSPNVAHTLMDDLETNHLGGRHVEATVLFADMVGFSSLSEELEPEAVNTLLNDYFTLIDEVAGRHKGHIDKYIGDCAMILFGAPFHDDAHGINGINCGVEILQVLEEYNRTRYSKGKIIVDFSVAVNSGTMLAGNMGSERRMEYTVIGDAVNLASRLSSIATARQILVTRELHDLLQLDGLFKTRCTQTVKLRGKNEPVEVWQVESLPRKVVAASELADMQTSSMVH